MGMRLSEKEFAALLGKGHVRVAQSVCCATPPRRRSVTKKHAARGRGATPHDKLWEAVHTAFPAHAYRECPAGIEGRFYKIDIALPCYGVAIEMDGWEWHGKHLGDFSRDRVRQNLVTCAGWRVLRYTAKQIHQELEQVMNEIRGACQDAQLGAHAAPAEVEVQLLQVRGLACQDAEAIKGTLGCCGRMARLFVECLELSFQSGTMPGASKIKGQS